MWTWGYAQQKTFEEIKQQLSAPPGLALCNPKAEIVVSADASSYRIQGAENRQVKPEAYASRALSSTEQKYVQVEKEALATTWAYLPWYKVRADLFQIKDQQYLLVVDYFSSFFEVAKLNSTSSEAVTEHFKSIFEQHSVAAVVRTDNAPQFSSENFRKFASEWDFQDETSSPQFPQSNGEAERAV
ncbi:hypothetical protein SRHO_G00105290 [Serrasalmus rhombeus]